jgi:hypothetical protein
LSLAFSVPPVFSTPSFPVHPARPFYTDYAFYHLLVLYSISNPNKPHQIIQTLMDVWQTFQLFCPIHLFYHFPEFHQPFPLICSSLTILNRRFKLLLISPLKSIQCVRSPAFTAASSSLFFPHPSTSAFMTAFLLRFKLVCVSLSLFFACFQVFSACFQAFSAYFKPFLVVFKHFLLV